MALNEFIDRRDVLTLFSIDAKYTGNMSEGDEHGQPFMAIDLMRWFVLPFACIAAWYVAFFIGLVILSIAESFCPEDQQVSGMCVAPWWKPVETCIFCFSTGLSAFLVIVTAYLVAPTARVEVAWLAFGIGAMTAIFFAAGVMEMAVLWMCASAIVTGFLTALVLTRFSNRSTQAQPHDRH